MEIKMKYIFCLDQEGVITENHESKPGCEYFNIFPADIELRPGVIEAFKLMKEADAEVHIVTNQAWIELASMNKQEREELMLLDLQKRCTIIQMLGCNSEIIKGWWVSTIVPDGSPRSIKKSEALFNIAGTSLSKYEQVILVWIGDTDSDIEAGYMANNDLERFTNYKQRFNIIGVVHGRSADISNLLSAVKCFIKEK